MVVKLVRAVVEEAGRGSRDASRHLEMGKEYVVLTVDVTWLDLNTNWIVLWIHHDKGSEIDWGLWSVHHFEVTSTAIPSSWTIQPKPSGFTLTPKAWTRSWHWDHLTDPSAGRAQFTLEQLESSVRQAWEDYLRERDAMLTQAGFATP